MSSEDEIRFQFLAENSIDVICRAGMDMVLHYVSPSCFHVLGWQPEEMIGRRPDAFVFSEGDSRRVLLRTWIILLPRFACEKKTAS